MDSTFHNARVATLPELLSPVECLELMALAEAAGFGAADVRTLDGPQALPTIRNNERALLEHPDWVSRLWQRVQGRALPALEGWRPLGLPRALRFYRYRPGQRFKMHKDGPWHEDEHSSRLTLLVYLNQDFAGGATDFRDFQVQPRIGDGLVFVHDCWHEGAVVTQGTKWVLRSDVMGSP